VVVAFVVVADAVVVPLALALVVVEEALIGMRLDIGPGVAIELLPLGAGDNLKVYAPGSGPVEYRGEGSRCCCRGFCWCIEDN